MMLSSKCSSGDLAEGQAEADAQDIVPGQVTQVRHKRKRKRKLQTRRDSPADFFVVVGLETGRQVQERAKRTQARVSSTTAPEGAAADPTGNHPGQHHQP